MNNRDRQYSRNRRNRYEQERDYYGNPRQAEQFRDDDYMNERSDWGGRGYRSGGQMGGSGSDWDESDYRSSRSWNRDRDYGQRDSSDDDYTGRSYFDRGYGNQRTRDFDGGNFGGEDYVTGGRETSRSYGGSYGGGGINAYGAGAGAAYGAGSAGRGYSDYGGRGNRGGDRGFFDKAGDEVASWFGDDEAAHRREQDHSGRGPSNYTRSDDRILEDACDQLTRDWNVDARNIQVTADDGEVTLDGTVDSRRAKRRAEDCVDDVSGVKHVQNNLRVQETDNDSDSDPNDYGTSADRRT